MRAWLLLLAVAGCGGDPGRLTVAVALLPSEFPAYRPVLDDFERRSGARVLVVA